MCLFDYVHNTDYTCIPSTQIIPTRHTHTHSHTQTHKRLRPVTHVQYHRYTQHYTHTHTLYTHIQSRRLTLHTQTHTHIHLHIVYKSTLKSLVRAGWTLEDLSNLSKSDVSSLGGHNLGQFLDSHTSAHIRLHTPHTLQCVHTHTHTHGHTPHTRTYTYTRHTTHSVPDRAEVTGEG